MDPLQQWLIDNGLPPPTSTEPDSALVPPLGSSEGGPGSFTPAEYPNFNPYLYGFPPYAFSPYANPSPTPFGGTPPQDPNFSGGVLPPLSNNLPPNPFGTTQQPGSITDVPGGNTLLPADPSTVSPEELAPQPDVLPAQPVDPTIDPNTQPFQNVPQPNFTPPGSPGLYAGGIPNTWGQPTNWANLGRQVGNFFGNAFLDPSVGYYSPDYLTSMGYTSPMGAGYSGTGIPIPTNASPGAVAFGLGPLPGSYVGGMGGNLGSSGMQNAVFHGLWGGRNPLPFNIWNAGAGTDQAWASQPGGTYANYLNLWANLRNRGATPTAGPGGGATGGPGGAGRPFASAG